MSPRAGCLASTLWLQATLGILAPAVLLLTWQNASLAQPAQPGAQAAIQGDAEGPGGAAAHPPNAGRCPWLPTWLDEWLQDLPWPTTLFLSQLLWLLLRVVCALALPL